MKTYEKPKLIALSLAADNLLCSGCANKLRDDPLMNGAFKDVTGDDVISNADFGEGRLFASAADRCGEEYSGIYEGYCKFTLENNVIWS